MDNRLQIPMDELKQGKFFVNHDAKKRPYNAESNSMASPNDPTTWSTYEAAAKNVETGKRAGVGIMFDGLTGKFDGKYDGYALAGIDIDVHDDGLDRNPITDEVLLRFKDAYIEKSPSGKGYHILFIYNVNELLNGVNDILDNIDAATNQAIGSVANEAEASLRSRDEPMERYGDIFFMKNKQLDLECYAGVITNRYYTFTQNTISVTQGEDGKAVEQALPKDAPRPALIDMTAEMKQFLNDYMYKGDVYADKVLQEKTLAEAQKKRNEELQKAAEKKNGTSVEYTVKSVQDMSDDELLERMFNSKNGSSIRALFYGDTSRYNNDHSAADLALCTQLAFWTGGDAERIEQLFERSGLNREKWQERSDYRERTISLGIATCSGNYYDPLYNQAQRPYYDKEAAQDEKRRKFITEMIDKYGGKVNDKEGNIKSTIDAWILKYSTDDNSEISLLQGIINDSNRRIDNAIQKAADDRICSKESDLKGGMNNYSQIKTFVEQERGKRDCSIAEAMSAITMSDSIRKQIEGYLSFLEVAQRVASERLTIEIAANRISEKLEEMAKKKEHNVPTLE